MRFPLGRIVATPGALEALDRAGIPPALLIARHVSGDWGDLCADDRAENELALKDGLRIFSSYNLDSDCKVWVITEYDRSCTTLLFPSDY